MRALQVEFGAEVGWVYAMGGLAREFAPDPGRVVEWLRAGERGRMPVDPLIWVEGAPRSSYPASLAVKAAAEQGLDGPYLRRVREGLLARRRRLDAAEALVEEARAVPGLDLERFRIDLSSNAIVERFAADLEVASAAGERARSAATGPASAGARAPLPTIEVRGEDSEVHGVYGFSDPEPLRAALRAAGARPAPEGRPGVEEALARFGSMATAEVAAVCDLPGPRAAAELWRLALEWRVRPEQLLTGELWLGA